MNRAAFVAALHQRPATDLLAHDVAALIEGHASSATSKFDRTAAATVAGFLVMLPPDADVIAEAVKTAKSDSRLWLAGELAVALIADAVHDAELPTAFAR